MANPQPTDHHSIMAHSIEEQLMVSDFTEQQGRILRLILRLSWGCGKKWALIPHQADFEVVRVGQGKVKRHLDWLITARVIFRQGDYYAFNKDFDQWRVSRSLAFTAERMKDLVHRNLEDRGSPDLTEKVRNSGENLTNLVSSEGEKLTKKVSSETENLTEKVRQPLPKREGIPYLKGKTPTSDLGTAKDSKDSNTTYLQNSNQTKKETGEKNVRTVAEIFQELEPQFPDLDITLEYQKYQRWHQGRPAKNPEVAVLNWLVKGREIKARIAAGGTAGAPQGSTPDKFTAGKYGHLVQR